MDLHIELAALAIALRTDRLCRDCIARRTGIPRPEVGRRLQRVAETISLIASGGRCTQCGARVVVYRLMEAGLSEYE